METKHKKEYIIDKISMLNLLGIKVEDNMFIRYSSTQDKLIIEVEDESTTN